VVAASADALVSYLPISASLEPKAAPTCVDRSRIQSASGDMGNQVDTLEAMLEVGGIEPRAR
jgi:hypothetical protein